MARLKQVAEGTAGGNGHAAKRLRTAAPPRPVLTVRLRHAAAGLAVLLALAGCATQPGPAEAEAEEELILPYDEPRDPLEPVNRVIFDVNLFLDELIIRPVAEIYRFFLPPEVRDGVRNFVRNLRTPIILANDILQGEAGRAGDTLARFLVNSTVGVGGLLDVAEDQGYPFHDEDFGQTLAVYGVGEGFYLVLPILGPSTLRDTGGMVADTFLDPLTYVVDRDVRFARAAVSGVDLRSRNIETLEELRRGSIDFYARVRNVYRQRRQNEIENGELTGLPSPGLL